MNTPAPQAPPETQSPPIRVSVIVPVYNASQTLDKCLDSLAAQTCQGIEFICINDGSTDTSADILSAKAARDSRFRILHQANGGYGKAMNTGIDAAKGCYIGIVEPDDWIEASMYEQLWELAEKSGADICKANYYIERRNRSRINTKFDDMEEGRCVPPRELPNCLKGSPSIWSAIYRTAFLQENHIRFSETPGASFQDLGFCIRTWLAAGNIAITHAALYHYWEDNPESSSRKMEDGAWAAFHELSLLSGTFKNISREDSVTRSLIVLRIFATLRADYRLRVRNTAKSFLLKYSHLLNDYFPMDTLRQDIFTRAEWHDLQVLYTEPLLFPRKSKTRATLLQRLISYRKEGNHHVFRFLGMSFMMKRQSQPTKPATKVSTFDKNLPYDLTVATVCWNARQFLPRCIESVQPLYQSTLKVEHLFIDGASTDGTLEYLQQQLAEGRITRIISEPDKGLYDAMNKAIRHAQGKIIVFINADDEICPAGTPACCEPILSGRAEYTAGQALCISDDTKKTYMIRPRIKNVLWRQPYCHQSMFCSTELLRRVGGFNYEKFRIGADTDLMRRLYIADVPFEAVHQISAHFYTGGVSYSPAVRTEVFDLMMHFTDAYCAEAKKRPATSRLTLKHLRRYTARMILQQDGRTTLSEKDQELLTCFVSKLAHSLSPLQRQLLRWHQQMLYGWYTINSKTSSKKARKTHCLHADISKLFIQCISKNA